MRGNLPCWHCHHFDRWHIGHYMNPPRAPYAIGVCGRPKASPTVASRNSAARTGSARQVRMMSRGALIRRGRGMCRGSCDHGRAEEGAPARQWTLPAPRSTVRFPCKRRPPPELYDPDCPVGRQKCGPNRQITAYRSLVGVVSGQSTITVTKASNIGGAIPAKQILMRVCPEGFIGRSGIVLAGESVT